MLIAWSQTREEIHAQRRHHRIERGAGAQITPAESAAGIANVIDRLSLDNAGGFWKWDGSRHEW